MFCKYCNNEIRRVGNSKKWTHVLLRPYNDSGVLCKRRPTPRTADVRKAGAKKGIIQIKGYG
jgi:hypothetical protein